MSFTTSGFVKTGTFNTVREIGRGGDAVVYAAYDATRNLTGRWDSSFKRSDGGSMDTTLQLKQEGQKLTGSQSFNDNETEIRDGKVEGDQVTFRIVRERDGRTVTSKYRGTIQKDNSIKGQIESDWTGEVRKLEWEAKKAK